MNNDSFFFRHLREADEGYFEHLAFTLRAASILCVAGVAVLVHGLVPCVFVHTGSTLIDRLNAALAARKAACRERRGAAAFDDRAAGI